MDEEVLKRIDAIMGDLPADLVKDTAVAGIEKNMVTANALKILLDEYKPFGDDSNVKLSGAIADFLKVIDEVVDIEYKRDLERYQNLN